MECRSELQLCEKNENVDKDERKEKTKDERREYIAEGEEGKEIRWK